MWASGLESLGIGEGVSAQGSRLTPVINAILLGGPAGEYFMVSLKAEPQAQLFCPRIPGAGRRGRGSGERGPLVKELRSCYIGG